MKKSSWLSDEQVSYLMKFARQKLERIFGVKRGNTLSKKLSLKNVKYEKINVTLRCRGELLGSQKGEGKNLLKALKQAVHSSANDSRFQRQMVAADLDETYIEIWIQTSHKELKNNDLEAIKKKVILGVNGLEVINGTKNAYYKPSVVITSKIKSHKRLLEKLCKKAKLEKDAWQNAETRIQVTKWLHFVEVKNSEAKFTELNRLRPVKKEPLTKEKVEKALKIMLDNMLSLQSADGKYTYIYNADKNTHSNLDFNMVRLAGCIYSMTWASSYIDEPVLKEKCKRSAKKALRYLFSYAKKTPDGTYFFEQSDSKKLVGKLGTVALALLSLEFGEFPEIFKEERQSLVKKILSMQKQDGSFECYINKKVKSSNNQNYYPGEALLALCHEVINLDNEEVISAIEKSFSYYSKHFYSSPSTAFILWQSDVWSLFHNIQKGKKSIEIEPKTSKYARFVFDQVDWLLKLQYTEEKTNNKDYIGGFYYPKEPTFSTCAAAESIIKAAILAHSMGLKERFLVYKKAALSSVEFIIRLQITKELSFLFPRPELVIGGITNTVFTFAIRNDFDQHAITTFLSMLQKAELFFD
jgi:AMMECR1 domain-containing protein